MAQAITLVSAPANEWLRRGVVCGCALALIMAGQAFPGF